MPKTILLAEDYKDILDILHYMLTDEGYKVLRSDGSDALDLATAQQPDLIILDHRLKSCWGADICRQLKNESTTRDIPVIMMSATMRLEETALSAGADAILKKPFNMADILNVTAAHLH